MIIRIITNGEEREFNIDRLSDLTIENERGKFYPLGIANLNLDEEDVMDYIINELNLDPEDLTYRCSCDECLKWNGC